METPASLLDTLAEVSRRCHDSSLSPERRLALVLNVIVNSLEVDKASIMMREGRGHLTVRAATRPEIIGVRVPLDSESPSAWVVRNKAPLYVDEENPAGFFHKKDRYVKHAFFSVPLMRGKRVIGVLNVTEKRDSDLISETERKLVLDLCARFITALENERLAGLLRKRERDLKEKNRALKNLERVKNDLFNMLVHDMKGPIAEISCLHSILAENVSGENRQILSAADAACGGLSQMVTNLLDVVRLEEGKLIPVTAPVDPSALLAEAITGLSAFALLKDISFVRQEFPLPGAAPLVADRTLVLRVLTNLLTNAIRHSPVGLLVEAGFLYPSSREIAFFVKDEGAGVPEAMREKIFDKFARVEDGREERSFSTGLGLAFCKLAVEAHGGRIRVEDAAPRGSRFFFTLPLSVSGEKRRTEPLRGKGRS